MYGKILGLKKMKKEHAGNSFRDICHRNLLLKLESLAFNQAPIK